MGEASLRPAAGYIRESTKMQKKGFGADVQRQAISDYAPTVGCEITTWGEDTARGRITTRDGYQAILRAVRAGAVEAVIVNMFDRAGRDGPEFVRFAHELQRLHVDLYSVHQGKDEPGVMRYVHAGMAEEEVVKLARRVRPAKVRSVEGGQHNGVTPFGYVRVYQEVVGTSRKPAGLLTPVEPAASYVRELFARAAKGWSLKALALWMNADPGCPRAPKGGEWTATAVYYILRSPTYYGYLRYNTHRVGYYDTSEPGSEFIARGRHEPLVTKELFDQVQASLDMGRKHNVKTRLARPLPFATGVLVCADCGGPMTVVRRQEGGHGDQYVCSRRNMGAAPCHGVSYLCHLAHDALLAQLGRLQGHPWQPQALDRIIEADPASQERARLLAELHEFETAIARHARRVSLLEDDMTDEELIAFRAVGKELSDAIKERKAALAALPIVSITSRELAALHQELAHMSLGDVVSALAETGDTVGLRDLVLKLVDRARVVDRVPAKNSRWLRAEVTWAPNVQLLIDAGLLALAPDVASPDIPVDPVERRRARQRAYHRAKKSRAV